MQTKVLLITCLAFAIGVFNACEDEDTRPLPGEIDFEVSNVSEFNGDDGAVVAEVKGGEGPFYYFWNTGDTTRSIDSLRAGEYFLRVTYGENGRGYLKETVKIEEPQPQPLDVTAETEDSPKFAKPWGEISLTISGGNPPYTIEWSDGESLETDSSVVLEDLFAGTYSFKISDSSEPSVITAQKEVQLGEADFVCGEDSIRDVDGNYYGTVELAGKCWTVDNLKTEHNPASPDSLIPIEGRYCHSEKNFCNQAEGAHYTWDAMMNGEEGGANVQGIAPQGWRIPSKAEWQELRDWLSIEGNGGSGTNSWSKVMGEDSPSGLDFITAGNWGYGIFSDPEIAAFWASDAYSEEEAEGMYLLGDANIFFQRFNFTQRPKIYGLSVRCVKDIEE